MAASRLFSSGWRLLQSPPHPLDEGLRRQDLFDFHGWGQMYPALHIHSSHAEEVSDGGVVEFDEVGSVALVVGAEGQPFSVWASFTLGHLFSFMAIAAGELVAVLCSSS